MNRIKNEEMRFTKKKRTGGYELNKAIIVSINAAIDQLGKYEDLGYTPDDLQVLIKYLDLINRLESTKRNIEDIRKELVEDGYFEECDDM